MVNANGTLTPNSTQLLSLTNRGYTYGDGLFETLKVVHGQIFFWEDHYFRLMASMRILRMEIPMNFTMEFLEQEILKTIEANQGLEESHKVRLYVNRVEGGLYYPESNAIDYFIRTEPLALDIYTIDPNQSYVADLFKDFYTAPGLLSSLKSNNRLMNTLGSIYAKENDLDTCLLLNTNKEVIEGLNGNLFLVSGHTIKTAPLTSGCVNGVMRKQVIELIKSMPDFELEETPISAFELQKADALFLTNVIVGIQPISKYRKKQYSFDVARLLCQKLNVKLRLSQL